MTKSMLKATSGEVGVETGDIMTGRVGLTAGTYVEKSDQVRFWEDLVGRIQAQPGVKAAAVTTSLPATGSDDGPISIEGRDYGNTTTKPFAESVRASNSYFGTFRIAAREGRVLDSRDTAESLPVVVINEAMAKKMWPDGSPIGARLRFDFDEKGPWRTVVGIVPDVVYDDDGGIDPTVYTPVSQSPERFMSIALRGDAGDPRTLVGAMRTALAQTDPDLALYWVRTLEEQMAIRTAGFRIVGTIFAIFAGVALVLAAAGLFGVLAFHVGQRTREIGVRRALGADDRRIFRLVLRASGLQVAIGIVIGMLFLPLMARGLGDILGDEGPFDPVIYSLVLALMIAVAIAATLTPTRRALKIDPAAALRYE
jgi:predicted permease